MRWTKEVIDRFKELAPYHTRQYVADTLSREFGQPCSKSAVQNMVSKTGIKSQIPNSGYYQKGLVPFNKGMSWDDYMPKESQEGCRRTQFKNGRSGVNDKYANDGELLDERISKDGYIEIRIDNHPTPGTCDNWVKKHRLVYQVEHQVHLPSDVQVRFADGDETNLDIDNLVVVTKAQSATINKQIKELPYYDRDSLECVKAIVDVQQAISAKKRKE